MRLQLVLVIAFDVLLLRLQPQPRIGLVLGRAARIAVGGRHCQPLLALRRGIRAVRSLGSCAWGMASTWRCWAAWTMFESPLPGQTNSPSGPGPCVQSSSSRRVATARPQAGHWVNRMGLL